MVYQIPESAKSVAEDQSDPLRSGRKCLLPAFLLGLVSLGAWLFRDYSDVIRYGMLLPASAGLLLGANAVVQFKQNGGSVGLRLAAIGIMGLNMGPVVHAMGWWMDH